MKTVNTISHKDVLASNAAYKAATIFRVIDFMNLKAQAYLRKAAGVDKITLDFLKSVAPDYFFENVTKTVKGVKVTTTEPRKEFKPYAFMCAIRKVYGLPANPQA